MANTRAKKARRNPRGGEPNTRATTPNTLDVDSDLIEQRVQARLQEIADRASAVDAATIERGIQDGGFRRTDSARPVPDEAEVQRRFQERLTQLEEEAINRAVQDRLSGESAEDAINRAVEERLARVLGLDDDDADADADDDGDGDVDGDDDGDGDVDGDDDVPVLKNAEVEFMGRTIEVRMPDIDQITIIRRLETTFNNASKATDMDADQALRLMSRALKAVTSVIVDQEDIDFIEDLVLGGDVKIVDTLPILHKAMNKLKEANQDAGNRATRRQRNRKSSGASGSASLVTTG